jgi:hypothetical protein
MMNVLWKSHIPTEPKQEYAYNKFTHISYTINLNPATEKIAVYKFIISNHEKATIFKTLHPGSKHKFWQY